jgi:ATP-dependent DNA helicase RecG
MKSPAVDVLASDTESLVTGRVVPIHPAVGEVAAGHFRRAVHNALGRARPIADSLPDEMVVRLGLISRDRALADIHFPDRLKLVEDARRRLVFDELFRLEVALALNKQRMIDEAVGHAHRVNPRLVERFLVLMAVEAKLAILVEGSTEVRLRADVVDGLGRNVAILRRVATAELQDAAHLEALAEELGDVREALLEAAAQEREDAGRLCRIADRLAAWAGEPEQAAGLRAELADLTAAQELKGVFPPELHELLTDLPEELTEFETRVTAAEANSMSSAFGASLPFPPTSAQIEAITEILEDLAAPHPMHRLLQGEVGSGKTLVAVFSLLAAVGSGFQGAVMAPTEVLAEQHYRGVAGLIDVAGMTPPLEGEGAGLGMESLFAGKAEGPVVSIALLTSNRAEVNFRPTGSTRREELMAAIAAGKVDIVVGTHALIQEGVHFDRLGLAVVDEQHRFGVHQRVLLKEKAVDVDPDLLIMTATPIPRTLSMTLYGDLDVSVLDEMPPGRTPVETRAVPPGELSIVYEMLRNQVKEGRQAFVVCPLVEDSPKVEAASATAEFERLQGVLPDLRLALLHGQMPPKEKEAVMAAFRRGEIDVLVATTVIEVGIDVPNATLMVIEDADRFGLSQLHQLRGRVGRGAHSSSCVLVADPTTDEGRARIGAMVATTDGFRLAEEDLRIRGQGTVFGTRQSGMADLRLADILRDADTLIAARREAFGLVARDPDLSGHPDVREEVRALLGDAVEWLFIS